MVVLSYFARKKYKKLTTNDIHYDSMRYNIVRALKERRKMKKIFLTSSPNGPRDDSYRRLDDRNGFTDRLRDCWKDNSKVLIISSDPSNHEQSVGMRAHYKEAFQNSGLSISEFDIWDYTDTPADLNYDCIILSGGPTLIQGMFFEDIGLREKIRDYDGIIIGISAGSMNSADIVYAQPEFPGNTTDPGYKRFYRGLGLTEINILPHYQEVKDYVIDGKRIYEDITYPDSIGREFHAFPDGTYLYIDDYEETICGEAYIIADGRIKRDGQ